MRNVLSNFLIALLLVAFAACDSVDEAREDAERFRGEWELTAVSDDSGSRTAEFEQLGAFMAEFAENDFALQLDPPQGDVETVLSGEYTVLPATGKVVLDAESGSQDIILDYGFENDDEELELTVPPEAVALINLATGFDFDGTIAFTFGKQ